MCVFHVALFYFQVVPKLRESLLVWREFYPLVQNLTNPDLKDRHWTKLIDVLGDYVDRGDGLTLEALLKIKVCS
jgi:dynein heavy chain